MTWCRHCGLNCQTHRDHTTGNVYCVECGKLISQDIYTEEATFVKDASGATRLSGNLVKLGTDCSESHRRTLQKGDVVINQLIDKYGISDVGHATGFYEMAVVHGFTRGRRTSQVAAACLYVACREKEKPFLLIEFSSELGVSVYELGTVYLQLCEVLNLHKHDFIQKPVDPSLFMHRYTSGLIGGDGNKKVLNTALHLAVSMKRDWIQTGRKPSGICAAAIYVSSVIHGYNFSRTDVVKAVHICEATLEKRLIEFENTKAGSLTIDEFTENAKAFEAEMRACKQSASDLKMPGKTEVVCQHKSNAVQSGFGLCKNCYLEFCGGLDGSEPPAFQRAEIQRLSKESVDSLTQSTPPGIQKTIDNGNGANNELAKEKLTEAECGSTNPGNMDKINDTASATVDETDTLSDIDDSEVSSYLHSEEESRFKKILWEQLNKEYMQEQAVKEAAEAAARKLYSGTPEEAQTIAAAAAKILADKKQKDKLKRAMDAKNAKPAQTPAEAAGQLFNKKKLSSKINYDALKDIFDDEPSPKKMRVDEEIGKEQKETEYIEDNDDENVNEWDNENEHDYPSNYVADDNAYFEEY